MPYLPTPHHPFPLYLFVVRLDFVQIVPVGQVVDFFARVTARANQETFDFVVVDAEDFFFTSASFPGVCFSSSDGFCPLVIGWIMSRTT